MVVVPKPQERQTMGEMGTQLLNKGWLRMGQRTKTGIQVVDEDIERKKSTLNWQVMIMIIIFLCKTFFIQKLYREMQVSFPKVPERRLACNNLEALKQFFIFQVDALERLGYKGQTLQMGG